MPNQAQSSKLLKMLSSFVPLYEYGVFELAER